MTLKQRFASQKTWMKGGIVGVTVCTLLFAFYIFIYFPMLSAFIDGNPQREEPSWSLTPPATTGHILPLLMHFAVEGSSIPSKICTETETHCLEWSLGYEEGGVSWVDGEGGAGYCLQQETSPLASCVERLEGAVSLIVIALLETIYFIIGAVTAIVIERRKKRA